MINHCNCTCSNCEKKLKQKEIHELFWDVYASSTSTASSIMRQLAFGEAAIFGYLGFPREFPSSHFSLSHATILAIVFLIAFFIFDTSHYLVKAETHRKKALKYEKDIDKIKIEDIIVEDEVIESSRICFYSKIICLATASAILILFKLLPLVVCPAI